MKKKSKTVKYYWGNHTLEKIDIDLDTNKLPEIPTESRQIRRIKDIIDDKARGRNNGRTRI